jgi:hypothetical protein
MFQGSRVPEITIPDDVPPGPLRDYLEWLRKLHKAAGHPSSRTLAKELGGCTHTTITRLFKAYPSNTALAFQLIRYLAENTIRPITRSDAEWDAFFDEAERMLERAKEPAPDPPTATATSGPMADVLARGSATVRALWALGHGSVPVAQLAESAAQIEEDRNTTQEDAKEERRSAEEQDSEGRRRTALDQAQPHSSSSPTEAPATGSAPVQRSGVTREKSGVKPWGITWDELESGRKMT